MKKNIKLSNIYDLWIDDDGDDEDDDEACVHYFSITVPFVKNKSLKTSVLFLNGVPMFLYRKSAVEKTSQIIQ